MRWLDDLKSAYYLSPIPDIASGMKFGAQLAGNAIKSKVVEKYDEASEAFNEASEKCSNWSDEKLIREAKQTVSLVQKMAYIKELQNRGYTSEDLQ